jgi:Domain of unknown function (DUF4185)
MAQRTLCWLFLGAVLGSPACRAQNRLAAVRVVSAQEITVAQCGSIVGRDGGYSVRAWQADYWLFGDSILKQPDDSGSTWRDQSLSRLAEIAPARRVMRFEEPRDARGHPRRLLPFTPEEAAYNAQHLGEDCAVPPCGARWALWPGAALWDAKRQRVLVFYQLIHALPGPFNFEGRGSSLALWSAEEQAATRPIVAAGTAYPTLLLQGAEPAFGSAARIEQGVLYAFGCQRDELAHHCLLGRVPVEKALERRAWAFWDGRRFSPDLRAAEPVLDAAPIFYVGRIEPLGQYLALYAEPMSNRVVMRTAPALTGPWSDAQLVFDVALFPSDTLYDALAHEELSEDGGLTQYVTYSRRRAAGSWDMDTVLVRLRLAPAQR